MLLQCADINYARNKDNDFFVLLHKKNDVQTHIVFFVLQKMRINNSFL